MNNDKANTQELQSKVHALATQKGCVLQFLLQICEDDPSIEIFSPNGKSFNNEMISIVCHGWEDAYLQLENCRITAGAAKAI